MTHGSLFSGIGGFDLASEWMGWENIFHCEWNPFGKRLLKYYWPNAISYHDITKTDFTIHRGRIDILTGGFPCQPYSMAGKRLGKEDERHLWPHMRRAIREIRPTWVVGENVLGLVNWSGGLVFEEVCADLEAEGYEVQPYVLPACAVNAPHRRDRVWFVAHSTCTSERTNELRSLRPEDGEIGGKRTQAIHDAFRPNGFEGNAADTNGNGLNGRNSEHEKQSSEGGLDAQCDIEQSNGDGDAADTEGGNNRRIIGSMGSAEEKNGEEWKDDTFSKSSHFGNEADAADTNGIGLRGKGYGIGNAGFISENYKRNDWEAFPTVPPVCHGDDGLSNRLDSITFSKWRQESIKGGGNAVVGQVVYAIFKTIEDYEQHQQSNTMGH